MVRAVLLLLLVAVTVITARRVRLPPSIALVGAGLVTGALARTRPDMALPFRLTPSLLFTLFLPPLLFEGAFRLKAIDVRRSARLVSLLAGPGVAVGVVVTALVTFTGMHALGDPIALADAFLFGAIVAATDPVAVVALLRDVRAPELLRVVLDAESLLNDGTAVVAFRITAAAVGTVSIAAIAGRAAWEMVGGLLVGVAVGAFGARVARRDDEPIVAVLVTLIVAYGSYVLGDHLRASAILAVVAAGFTFANVGGENAAVDVVWEVLAFGANACVFLLVGVELAFVSLPATHVASVVVAWMAMFVARALIVRGALLLTAHKLPRRAVRILVFGGLRGGLSMILALSLDPGPRRDTLVVLTFGAVALTIFVQGIALAVSARRAIAHAE